MDAASEQERDDKRLELSVVAPMHNEEGIARALVTEISDALKDVPFEIIIVDDGSRDETLARLREAKMDVNTLRIISHAANAGQSRAIRTGVLAARAPIVATLDGDGQNDPADILKLWNALVEAGGVDALAMVGGERIQRKDDAAKRWASKIANNARKRILKDGASDTGCGLKVFYRDAFIRLPYFDHMHRYLPALFRREGYEIRFLAVAHRPRTTGQSKYNNLDRLLVAFRDLVGVSWLIARAKSPGDIREEI